MPTKKKSSVNLDVGAAFRGVAEQFRELNPNEPGQWPILPRLAVWALVAVLVVVGGWFVLLSSAQDDLDAERAKEPGLKDQYRAKLAQAVNLEELKRQKLQVEEYVNQLEKQLPGKAEMAALLSDINQAGLGRGLQFELFRPGQVVIRDYYAELPISIKVSGRFHDMGSFAGDIAHLSRIVTLHNMNILGPRVEGGSTGSGALTMEATARTYRYLDQAEIDQVRQAAAAAAKAGVKK